MPLNVFSPPTHTRTIIIIIIIFGRAPLLDLGTGSLGFLSQDDSNRFSVGLQTAEVVTDNYSLLRRGSSVVKD